MRKSGSFWNARVTPFTAFLILFLLAWTASAQGTAVYSRLSTEQLESAALERRVPYNIILPLDYGSPEGKDRRYPVVYLLHGLTGHYGDWAQKSKLVEHSAQYGFIIVMPEGNNGWYTDAENLPNDRYESYIVGDLIPEIDSKYRTRAERSGRVIAGLSMGGYGALKFGLKHSARFVLTGSFSGALKAAEIDLNAFGGNWKALTDSVASAFGEMGSKTRYRNDLFRLLSDLKPEEVKNLPFIYLDCGTEDFLIKDNREFAAKLLELKVPHEFRQLPGAHDWKYWDKQIIDFMRVAERVSAR